MRRGANPQKRNTELQPYKRHRIIIPIYIGGDHEYFQECAESLKLSLRSLFATIDLNQASVTVINNNSTQEVYRILEPYIESGKIDRYIHNATNRGKPDAIAAELNATYEPLVTLTDCDVLFRHGWMRELENVFMGHRGVGAVSPFPAPNHPYYNSTTTWLAGLLSFKLRAGEFVKESDIDEFLYSVGLPKDHFPQAAKKYQFKLASARCDSLIGAGHFVVMLRTAAYSKFDYEPRLAGGFHGLSDIDQEPDRRGYLRLSTPKYHVYHIGNVPEDWMEATIAEIESSPAAELHSDTEFRSALHSRPHQIGKLPRAVKRLLFLPIRVCAQLYRKHRLRRKPAV